MEPHKSGTTMGLPGFCGIFPDDDAVRSFEDMSTSNPGRGSRVILADDHEWILQILTQVVQDTLPTAEVVAVKDGGEALEQYQRGGCDFLVTNHQMPHMDGATLIRQVRAQAPTLPILMISVKPEAKPEALAAGANWFLAKDQIMEHLPALLRQHVAGVPGRAEC